MVLIERDVIGGAAHLWDCIPSKAMIATGSALTYVTHSEDMGLDVGRSEIDIESLGTRLRNIEHKLERSITELLTSQHVELLHGRARLLDSHTVEVVTEHATRQIDADIIKAAAQRLGLDWERMQRDMADPAIQARLDANLKLASALEIEGTPAYVIGQQLLPGAMALADLRDMIALARKR